MSRDVVFDESKGWNCTTSERDSDGTFAVQLKKVAEPNEIEGMIQAENNAETELEEDDDGNNGDD